MSACENPSISRKVSVWAKVWRADAILIAASAVTATDGMAGFLKWAIICRSFSGIWSGVVSLAMARAISAMVLRLFPLPVFSSWAMATRV